MKKRIGDWLENLYWSLVAKREKLIKEEERLKAGKEFRFVPWKWDPETKEERENRIRGGIAIR